MGVVGGDSLAVGAGELDLLYDIGVTVWPLADGYSLKRHLAVVAKVIGDDLETRSSTGVRLISSWA